MSEGSVMANPEHLALLRQGVNIWNKEQTAVGRADLSGADLRDTDLRKAKLRGAYLREANLSRANLAGADLKEADLTEAILSEARLGRASLWRAHCFRTRFDGAILDRANLRGTDFIQANLRGASLAGAFLNGANLTGARLFGANLIGANLERTTMVGTHLQRANLTGCRIYGMSAWDLHLNKTIQDSLVITPERKPEVRVDHLEVAQFVYLLLANSSLRHVIDTLTTKVVLILGRFSKERLVVLEAVQGALRNAGYVPMLFTFAGPENQDVLETVQTVARLARFVVADITDARAVDQELQAIVPQIRVPVRPLILAGAKEPGKTFRALWGQYPDRLLKVYRYKDVNELMASFETTVISAAETGVMKLKRQELDDIFE